MNTNLQGLPTMQAIEEPSGPSPLLQTATAKDIIQTFIRFLTFTIQW